MSCNKKSIFTAEYILFSALCMLTQILFFGCSFFIADKPKLTDFLYEQENRIYVSSVSYENEYPTDSDGVLCIPSHEDVTLKFLIQNPSASSLTADITTAADSRSKNYQYDSSIGKTDIVELKYTKEMLTLLEMQKQGTDISPTLQLTTSGEYTYADSIEPYTETLRVNSAPPAVQGACVMVDGAFAGAQTGGKYVLCFNLPEDLFSKDNEDYGIHSDVIKGRIEGLTGVIDAGENTTVSSKKFEQSFDLELNAAAGTYNTVYLPHDKPSSLMPNAYANGGSDTTANGMPAANFGAWTYPVYITDNAYSSAGDVREYTITLIDEAGLETSVTVATNSKQLKPVTANADPTEVVTLQQDEYYTLILTAPTQTVGTAFDEVSDVTIVYKIYQKDYSGSTVTSTLVKKGEALNEVSCQLYEGTYSVFAYAHKDGYIDSEILKVNLYLGAKVEVPITINPPGLYNAYIGVAPTEFWTEDIDVSVNSRSFFVQTYVYSTETDESGAEQRVILTDYNYNVEMSLLDVHGRVIEDPLLEAEYKYLVPYQSGDKENRWVLDRDLLIWQTLSDEVYTLVVKVKHSETEIFSGSIPITVHYGTYEEGG